MTEKIKVAWICLVSNPKLRCHLKLGFPWWRKIVRRLLNKSTEPDVSDSAVWNTNALNEFEKIDSVELHVIFVHPQMQKKVQQFQDGGISYYAVSVGDGGLFGYVSMVLLRFNNTYRSTWRRISRIINSVKPSIIHLMGAENPSYSLSILSIPDTIPIITQLQTFLHDPEVLKYRQDSLRNQIVCERKVLLRTNYLGSKSSLFPRLVRENLREDAVFVNTGLFLGETYHAPEQEKAFDFVYFASSVCKDLDLVLEGFVRACDVKPGLKLDIIGSVTTEDLKQIDSFLVPRGLRNLVVVEGRLATHEDVINQIKKSRFAFLPLKSDLVSGTIREAMENGLPVITTITRGTPKLNANRESVLLSQIGDHDALAANMIRLLNDNELAHRLSANAKITVEEIYGNHEDNTRRWVEAYRACINNFRFGAPLPYNVKNNN